MLVAVVALLIALPPEAQSAVVAKARTALEVPYVLGGRVRPFSTKRGVDGLDCQGLVFFALQSISDCGWRSWSVLPTTSVQGELGLPVDGLAPVSAADLASKLALLQPGDILWFLDMMENVNEPSITTLDKQAAWVWHVGLYAGAGRFVVGDHFAGKVTEEELVPYVSAHYRGVFVTRMTDGPRPATCKKHKAMSVPPNKK
jgi:cell wall-associated NlpC family hydrolase